MSQQEQFKTMFHRNPNRVVPARQRGSALIIGMIFLLLLTLIGLVSTNNVTLEEKMAGNTRDRNLAFQAAEAALRDGEGWLSPFNGKPVECASAPCTTVWGKDVLPADLSDQSDAWWTTNGREYGTGGTADIPQVAQDPRYVIEWQDFVSDSLDKGFGEPTGRTFYRVTARGTGGTAATEIVLQTIFIKRFN